MFYGSKNGYLLKYRFFFFFVVVVVVVAAAAAAPVVVVVVDLCFCWWPNSWC